MADRVRPFISSTHRLDIVGQMARDYSSRIRIDIDKVVARGIDDLIEKKDGKDGAKDGGEAGFWDKKDGKEGKDKEKDGKESKEGKEGKEGKDDKEGKESKDAKEGKDSKDGKESKEGGKEDSKDGKDKEGKDKDDDGGKFVGSENEIFRYGDELVLPAETMDLIAEFHSVRVASLLNQPIF